MNDLTGKAAFFTGSTDGVGCMFAARLGAIGARVFVHGRNRERGTRVVAEIEGASGRAEFLPADLAALAEVRHRLAALSRELTGV
jgi:NAD(P)-dependent dehydrogenase (short-subunit alcohol dehydrogenase family)